MTAHRDDDEHEPENARPEPEPGAEQIPNPDESPAKATAEDAAAEHPDTAATQPGDQAQQPPGDQTQQPGDQAQQPGDQAQPPPEATEQADAPEAAPTAAAPAYPAGQYPQYFAFPHAPRRSPHPALIPLMVIGTVLAVLLTVGGLVSAPGARDLLDATARTQSAPAPTAPAAAPSRPVISPSPHTEITRAELDTVMDGQEAALRSGSAEAFLAPIDPAQPQLVAQQRRLFENLRLVPFQRAEFLWSGFSTAALQGHDTGRLEFRITVDFVHQVTGVDSGATVETYYWQVVRDFMGGPLRVTAVTSSDPGPWDIAELVKAERPHVILLVAAVDRAKAATWADRAEQAAKRDFELWKGPADIPSRFLVFASADAQMFDAAYGGKVPTGTVAFCAPMFRYKDQGPNLVAGSRITWDTDAKGMTAADAQTGVLRHEMGHALMGRFTGYRTMDIPLWVVEGFAEYLEWVDLFGEYYVPDARDYVRSRRFPGKLPADDDLYGEDPEANGINYHLSMTAVRYLVDKYGAAKMFTFVVAVYRDPTRLEAALKEATGLSLATFESNWAQWVKSHV